MGISGKKSKMDDNEKAIRKRQEKTISETQEKLGDGYAFDMCGDLLKARDPEDMGIVELDRLMPDALFRTLVLDEDWSIEDATLAYDAAYEIVEGPL